MMEEGNLLQPLTNQMASLSVEHKAGQPTYQVHKCTMYVWECVYVCMEVCVYGSMCVWEYVCMGVCVYGNMCVCECVYCTFGGQ